MPKVLRGLLVAVIALMVGGLPLLYHRYRLTTEKRLHVVVPDRFFRSGQMTATGLTDTIRRHHIRTVINVQNEFPDPNLRQSFLNGHAVKESELCRKLGARLVFIDVDLVGRTDVATRQPKAIAEFLAIMDDPANYPVLIHCKAGLHRTGCLVGVYRMHYEGRDTSAVIDEMKDCGFGESACTSANDYIAQYILAYPRRNRE